MSLCVLPSPHQPCVCVCVCVLFWSEMLLLWYNISESECCISALTVTESNFYELHLLPDSIMSCTCADWVFDSDLTFSPLSLISKRIRHKSLVQTQNASVMCFGRSACVCVMEHASPSCCPLQSRWRRSPRRHPVRGPWWLSHGPGKCGAAASGGCRTRTQSLFCLRWSAAAVWERTAAQWPRSHGRGTLNEWEGRNAELDHKRCRGESP